MAAVQSAVPRVGDTDQPIEAPASSSERKWSPVTGRTCWGPRGSTIRRDTAVSLRMWENRNRAVVGMSWFEPSERLGARPASESNHGSSSLLRIGGTAFCGRATKAQSPVNCARRRLARCIELPECSVGSLMSVRCNMFKLSTHSQGRVHQATTAFPDCG